MKNRTICFMLFIILCCVSTYTQTPVSINSNTLPDLKQVAELAFNKNIPTTSMYEPVLEKIYGKSGLNIHPDNLIKIKQAYCYLEFLVKLEYIQKTNSAQSKKDFAPYLQTSTEHKPYIPDATLLNSTGWQAISLTQTDVRNSTTWQNIMKAFLCDNQMSLSSSIIDAANLQQLIFTYVPNIEVTYDNPNTKIYWLYFQTIQMQQCLQQQFDNRYSSQCLDLQNRPQTEQIKNLESFKTTQFYIVSHTQQNINQTNPSQKNVSSSLQAQIICYFMFMYLQQLLTDFITVDNASSVILLANSQELQPNFLQYDSDSVLYLQDLLYLYKLQEDNKNTPRAATFIMNDTISGETNKNKNYLKSLPTPPLIKISPELEKDLQELDPNNPNFQQDQIAVCILSQMPIGSSFDDKLQQMYGPSGFNLPQNHIDHIKKIYTYLEFYAKLDKAKNDPKYATAAPDFAAFLEPHTDRSPRIPTQQLLQSNSWKSITIQEQDIISSPLWQNFLKMLLANNIDQTADFVTHNYAAQDQLFIYMPNIENAYSTQDFTALRLYQESLQHYEILQHIQRQYYISQCTDLLAADQNKINTIINTFKTTEYYTSLNQTLDKNNSNIPKPGALIIEQITGYFLITFLQKIIYQQLNTDNLEKILQQTQTVNFKTQIFFYTISDYIYVYNYLHLNNTIQVNKQHPIQDAIYMKNIADATDINKVQSNAKKFLQTQAIQQKFKTDGQKNLKANMYYITIQSKLKHDTQDSTSHPNNNVIIQNMWNRIGNSFRRAGDEFKKAGNDIKDAGQAINNTIISPASQTINNTIINPAAQALTAENIKKGFDIAGRAITKSVAEGISIASNTLADGFIEMSAKTTLLGCSIAQGFGVKVDPHAVADSVKRDLNRNRDIITGITGVAFVVAASIIAAPTLSLFFDPLLPPLLVTGTAIISEYQKNDKVKNSIDQYVTRPLLTALTPILTGMSIMTDGFTIGLIESVVLFTWCGCKIGQAFGINIDPNLEAHKIREKMEAQRAIINIVSSVIITVVLTVVIIIITAGLGVGALIAVDSMTAGQALAVGVTAVAIDATAAAEIGITAAGEAKVISNQTAATTA